MPLRNIEEMLYKLKILMFQLKKFSFFFFFLQKIENIKNIKLFDIRKSLNNYNLIIVSTNYEFYNQNLGENWANIDILS